MKLNCFFFFFFLFFWGFLGASNLIIDDRTQDLSSISKNSSNHHPVESHQHMAVEYLDISNLTPRPQRRNCPLKTDKKSEISFMKTFAKQVAHELEEGRNVDKYTHIKV